MANLWSHYLNKRHCPPQPSNFIYVVQQLTGIWSLLGKESVLAAETGNRCKGSIDVCTSTGTKPAQFFIQSHFHSPEMSSFLFFSSTTTMVLLSRQYMINFSVFIVVMLDKGIPQLNTSL